jgi:tetratricopeptide (TPR) repeat protein
VPEQTLAEDDHSFTSELGLPNAKIMTCLETVLKSQVFGNSGRLQEFLAYVVNESVQGRSKAILGKTVAQDVYGRNELSDGDPSSVVRVDARRLRRFLDDYYATEGADDPLRIHIDSGGYAPRFEPMSKVETPEEVSASSPARYSIKTALFVVAGLGALIGVLLIGAFGLGFRETPVSPELSQDRNSNRKILERQALLEKSPTALQAANLSDHARDMLLPIFDPEHQILALGLFQQVIRLDPDYFGGYAGAAQSNGILAMLSPGGSQKDTLLHNARIMTNKATALNPTHAWTQSAAAWVAFVEKDYDTAIRFSERATALAPSDGYILDFHGLITLFSGDFVSALEVSDPDNRKDPPGQRHGNRNIFAAANFHLGNYRETLASLSAAGERGDPISPPRLAYQAAAKQALEDLEGARADVQELMATWPEFRPDLILLRFFRDPADASAVIDRLIDVGWHIKK